MSKAGNVLRRSGVVLKSLGSTNTNLQLLINQLKETRSLSKTLASSQSAANQDLIKWAEQEDNRAIKETVSYVGELLVFYTEIQKSFTDRLKEFTNQFEMILEGEKLVSGAKNQLEVANEKENRIRKEVNRASKRRDSGSSDLRDWTEKLVQAQREKDMAQVELHERVREHEAVKLIRLKSGLLKLSNAHKETSRKTNILFSATHDIAQLIPDIADTSEIQEIRYTGSPTALRITMDTKEKLQRQDLPVSTPTSTYPDDLPPPYAEIQPPTNPYYSTDGAASGYDYSVTNSQNNSSFISIPNSTNNSYQYGSSFAQDANDSAPDGGQETQNTQRRSGQLFSDVRKRLSQISLGK